MARGAHHGGSLERSSCARLLYLLLVGLSLTTGLGCGAQPASSDAAVDISRIKELTTLYVSYLNRNAGRPPASEEVFKRYVAERGEPLF
jgi:hypothetical protein